MKKNSPQDRPSDLFDSQARDLLKKTSPLADRMRPQTLEEFIGQDHIIGEGRLLRRAIQIDQLSSLIFYGPPGTGKTTLARIIANTTKAQFLSINAVLAGIKDIRDAIESAQKTLSLFGRRTILFIDEVHRFNKAQQDALLPHVENGVLILIGATTENPYFEVNKALVSRSRIFQLRQLGEVDLRAVALQALRNTERGYGRKKISIEEDALDHLVRVANGDARGVLNALELAVETTAPGRDGIIHITRSIAEESIQQRAVLYDRDGDAHYDTISAFIKSLRGSDPDAALYWMAKMLYAGEDPRFIFRRMVILAGEDVGMADPAALGVVVNAARAFDYVGLPEGRFHLAEACLYLATAPKSNSSLAFFDAIKSVSEETTDDVPNHLRDASRDSEGFGHGDGYLYPHAYRDHWVAQQYLPSSLQGKEFYHPSDQGFEKSIAERVAQQREAQIEAMAEEDYSSPLAVQRGTDGSGWLERTLSRRGEQLSHIRETMLELAGLTKQSLVLDLNGRTGLLAFEAMRQTPDGGVWILAHDDRAYETLCGLVKKLPAISRPQIIRTGLASFDRDIRNAAGMEVRFDAILGRNLLFQTENMKSFVKRANRLLAKTGALVLAEPIPREGQRLSNLAETKTLNAQVKNLLAAAEEELFSDNDDPMIKWTAQSLHDEISSIDDIALTMRVAADSAIRRISPQDIEFWFREAGQSDRLSLGDRIRTKCDAATTGEIKARLHGCLDFKEIAWRSSTAFFKITFK
jgi:putative ATPase